VVLLWGRHLASWLLAMDEHNGLKDLCGSGGRSVIPYVYEKTELYYSSMYEPEPFLFFYHSEVASTRAFYSSRSGSLQ
jgi:hypothetical protein